MVSHQLDPVSAAIDAAIERALSRTPVALRMLLIAAENTASDIGVWRLAMRILPELNNWEFGEGWKTGRSRETRGGLDDLFVNGMLSAGGTVIADMAAGDNRARGQVAIAVTKRLVTCGIVMRRRMEAAE